MNNQPHNYVPEPRQMEDQSIPDYDPPAYYARALPYQQQQPQPQPQPQQRAPALQPQDRAWASSAEQEYMQRERDLALRERLLAVREQEDYLMAQQYGGRRGLLGRHNRRHERQAMLGRGGLIRGGILLAVDEFRDRRDRKKVLGSNGGCPATAAAAAAAAPAPAPMRRGVEEYPPSRNYNDDYGRSSSGPGGNFSPPPASSSSAAAARRSPSSSGVESGNRDRIDEKRQY